MIPKTEIKTILKRCRRNDRGAQELVYKSYFKRYYTLSLRYMKDHDKAMDAVSQAFFKIFTNIGSLSDPEMFEAWMKQIFIHTCLNELKRLKAHLYDNIEDHDDITDMQTNGNEGVANMNMEDLLNLVMKLPAQMRTVFNLYVIDGYNHAEISRQLDISAGTSKFHLHSARNMLKQMIQEQSRIKLSAGNYNG